MWPNIIVAQIAIFRIIDSKEDVCCMSIVRWIRDCLDYGIMIPMQIHWSDVALRSGTGSRLPHGAVLLAGAQKTSFLHLNSASEIHQPSGGMRDNLAIWKISLLYFQCVKGIVRRSRMTTLVKTYEEYDRDSDRDYWLKAPEANIWPNSMKFLVKNHNNGTSNLFSFGGRIKKNDVDLMVSGIFRHKYFGNHCNRSGI